MNSTGAASSAEHHVRDERDVVVGMDVRPALGTVRVGPHDRLTAWTRDVTTDRKDPMTSPNTALTTMAYTWAGELIKWSVLARLEA